MSTHAPLGPEYAALVDDAAVFPPGNAPLEEALAGYRQHAFEPHADLVGPFVIKDVLLPELAALAASSDEHDPLPVTVVVSGGAGGLEPAAQWVAGATALEARGFEIALRDLDDLPGAARRVVTAAAGLGTEVPVYVEVPVSQPPTGPGHGWLAALDEVAAADLRLKFRTGGESAELFPSTADLGTAIDAALDRELPFKCTAGLHHAVRHTAEDTGFEHHGFLNVLLAVRATLDGGDVDAALEERDADAVAARVRKTGSDALVRARRWFTSFGCCGVTDPFQDLLVLGLVTDASRS